jgi:hypothetical protein
MTVRVSTDWSYRGLQAVVLENERVRVVVLPELGGKIWQLTALRAGRDLLWHNPRLHARTIPFGSVYDDMFLGGWDELFPNDVPEELAGEPYPDHGELWASPWSWAVERDPQEVRVTLELQAPVSACSIVKTLTLRAGEASLSIRTRITNPTARSLPYLWKQHLAMPTREPATIGLGAASMLMADFGSPRAGGPGDRYAWPEHRADDGTVTDMSSTLPRESRVSEFQYATDLTEGRCSVTYADGTGLELHFDREVFRSCWIFASYGGWREHEVVVLEPCTGYPVSVQDGVAAGTHQILEPGGCVETELTALVLDGADGGVRR